MRILLFVKTSGVTKAVVWTLAAALGIALFPLLGTAQEEEATPAILIPRPGRVPIVIQLDRDESNDQVDIRQINIRANPGGTSCNPGDVDNNYAGTDCEGLINYVASSHRKLTLVVTRKNPTCVTVIIGGTAKTFCQ